MHSEDSNLRFRISSLKNLFSGSFPGKMRLLRQEKSSIEKPRKKSRSKEGDCSPVASRMGGKKESKGFSDQLRHQRQRKVSKAGCTTWRKSFRKSKSPPKLKEMITSNEKILKKSPTKQLNLQKSNSPVYSNLKTVLYKISPRSIHKVSNLLFSQKKSLDFGHNTVTTFPSGLKAQKTQTRHQTEEEANL
jgi:hypothetical protein